jgi:hypothetical protein
MSSTPATTNFGDVGGFFSRIIPDFEAGLGSLGRDVLPAWAARRLGVPEIYRDSTYNPNAAPSTVNDFFNNLSDRVGAAAGRAAADRAVQRGALVAGVVAVLGTVAVVYFLRKK